MSKRGIFIENLRELNVKSLQFDITGLYEIINNYNKLIKIDSGKQQDKSKT